MPEASWKRSAYQVSPPCIVWFASLRIEEVVIIEKCLRSFFVNGCHENDKILIRSIITIILCAIVCKFEK